MEKEKPIGGQFIPEAAPEEIIRFEAQFGLRDHHRFFASGRGALRFILEEAGLQGKTLLMPDFGCWESFGPVLAVASVDFRVYKVARDFSVQINPDDLAQAGGILLINYFGLVDYGPLASDLKNAHPDLVIIADQAQALYTLANDGAAASWADWQFYSLRKHVGTPDGALVLNRDAQFDQGQETGTAAYQTLWQKAADMKRAYFDGREAGEFWPLFIEAEQAIPFEPLPPSALSYELLDQVDWQQYETARQKNFLYLLEHWTGGDVIEPGFEALPAGAVPHYFPVLTAPGIHKRLLDFLIEGEIFCPAHWPIWKTQPDLRSSVFSGRLLSLPVDQRYNEKDMQRILDALADFVNEDF